MAWTVRADAPAFERQQFLYEAMTGDKPQYLGYSRRFTDWLDKNPRRSLTPPREGRRRTDPSERVRSLRGLQRSPGRLRDDSRLPG